ncbi:Predicted oxidoreductase [Sphingobium faniae]|nr:Predicted oxidoreductase [Sphingobium faniae]
MITRSLGSSGLEISGLILGTATFGGAYAAWGASDIAEATRIVDIALHAGITMFDTADVYSAGAAEEILGRAIGDRRSDVLIATKVGMRMSDSAGDAGLSRGRIIASCEASLRRLRTDHIDLYQLHAFDGCVGLDETLGALDELQRAGKIRYHGVSNFSGWHLMKTVAAAERLGVSAPVAQQAYYSLVAREFEWELMPLGDDQDIATLVYSPLGGARLSGKLGRGKPVPQESRVAAGAAGPGLDEEKLYSITDALEAVASEGGWTVAQVALAWALGRPTVAGLVIGARNEDQLVANLGAADIRLSSEQVERLDAASAQPAAYPYWHQQMLSRERNVHPLDASRG